MYGINYNDAWKIKNQFIITDFFNIWMLYLTCIKSFYMLAQSVYWWVWSLYLCTNIQIVYSIPGAMSIPAGTICLPMGMIRNQIHVVSVKLCIFSLLANVVTGAKKLLIFRTLYWGTTREWWTDFTNLKVFWETPKRGP